jgi:hypothetical protein
MADARLRGDGSAGWKSVSATFRWTKKRYWEEFFELIKVQDSCDRSVATKTTASLGLLRLRCTQKLEACTCDSFSSAYSTWSLRRRHSGPPRCTCLDLPDKIG